MYRVSLAFQRSLKPTWVVDDIPFLRTVKPDVFSQNGCWATKLRRFAGNPTSATCVQSCSGLLILKHAQI